MTPSKNSPATLHTRRGDRIWITDPNLFNCLSTPSIISSGRTQSVSAFHRICIHFLDRNSTACAYTPGESRLLCPFPSPLKTLSESSSICLIGELIVVDCCINSLMGRRMLLWLEQPRFPKHASGGPKGRRPMIIET